MEKHFKQFQVVEAAGGELLAALGLEVAGTEGRLHGEVFAHAEQSDALRDLFWERLQVLAKNHGNRTATATELGISLRKLYYRLGQYQREGLLP